MELGLDPGKSSKVMKNKPNGCRVSDHVHVFGLYIHYHCPLLDLVRSLV